MPAYIKISEFAKLAGISRKNLIFYDDIGLLKPEKIDDNGYRLYTYQQVYLVSIIAAFRDLGMPLKDIKAYIDTRTPTQLLNVFQEQTLILEEKLQRLHSIQHMIDFRIQQTLLAHTISFEDIILKKCPEEIFFASEELHLTDRRGEEQAWLTFYNKYDEERMIYGYPMGACISKETLERGDWQFPDRYYSRQLPHQIKTCRYVKPAGLYLIAYCHIGYAIPTKVYKRMFEYIKKNNLTIAGCSYEEFLLDEVCVKNPEEYVLQISIQISSDGCGIVPEPD